MEKEFFDRQLRVGLDLNPLTKDWTEDEKAAFVQHTSVHMFNNWAMVVKRLAVTANQKPRGDRQ